MNMQLRPSFLRASTLVVAALVVVTAVLYLWQGYYEHRWWTRDYILSLFIPFSIAPIAVWFIFVPTRLEFNDTHFSIQMPFRRLYTLPWSDLQFYATGRNVFMIQFSGAGTFQLFAHAFRKREWAILKNFLSSTFPERKASGYVGDRMFKRRRRRT